MKKLKIILSRRPIAEKGKPSDVETEYSVTRYRNVLGHTTDQGMGIFLSIAEANRAVLSSLDEYDATTWERSKDEDLVQRKHRPPAINRRTTRSPL